MLIKSESDEIQSYLSDASNMSGFAERVAFPESAQEVSEILAEATRTSTPVTVSGAGTGIVGGRVPQGGIVLATDRMDKLRKIVRDPEGGYAIAQTGIVLADFERLVAAEGLLYPPDPTERSCFLGATVATNASGARTFKYGPTRDYVRGLQVALPTGDLLNIQRNEILADKNGHFSLPVTEGRTIQARLPTYRMPQTRKHASGYYVSTELDLIDLFIGSEGTLGVITEVEVTLLPRPEGLISGIVFFRSEEDLLAFVQEARERSLETRVQQKEGAIDARALEYFDNESLRFLHKKYSEIPAAATGAVFFEQETSDTTEDVLMDHWLSLLESHGALTEESWFAANENDQERLREFRHALPALVNEWLARQGQRKVSTDMAVPDEAFPGMLRFYEETLRASDLQYVIFGHIGDNHVHVNMLPRDDTEAAKARELYLTFIDRAVAVGGTVSAEHGIGKLKRQYLEILYGKGHLREMAELKRAFDPAAILGRGNMFSEELLGL
ncbi:MAG TPA: FAD-binding oxidoreductase [Pyrinomonadaceae bacterium]|nr:FAD-binding oxidoreductase [Pyrinomonadaceae bacterium]